MSKHRLSASLCLVLALTLLLMPMTAFAGGENGKGEYTVEIKDVHMEDGEFKADFDEEIEIEGEKYIFKSVEYVEDDVERQTYNVTSEKLFRETIVTEDGETKDTGLEEVEFPETYTDENGVVYKFVKKSEPKVETIPGRTAEITLIAERNSTKNGPAPLTKEALKFIDPDTGTEKELPEEYKGQILDLESSELKNEYWGASDYSASMTFSHYEYTSFNFNGIQIPKNEAKPMSPEYYYLVLRQQNLDQNLFRITDISWAGEEYTDGVTWYRKAAITGDVYNMEYEDTYKGTIDIPDITYSTTTAIYEETDEFYDEHRTATAFVTYSPVPKETETETDGDGDNTDKSGINRDKNLFDKLVEFFQENPVVFYAAIILILLAIAVAIVLPIVKKKKKKDESEEQ